MKQVEAIRDAIAREDYGAAYVLWDEYAAGLRREVALGLASADQMREVGELFEWSRLALLGARAQLMARLNARHIARIYGAAD